MAATSSRHRATVTRLRLGLEASRTVSLGRGTMLNPNLELGVQYDGGDAETRFGLDVGGGLRPFNPTRGLEPRSAGVGSSRTSQSGFASAGSRWRLSGTRAGNGEEDAVRGVLLLSQARHIKHLAGAGTESDGGEGENGGSNERAQHVGVSATRENSRNVTPEAALDDNERCALVWSVLQALRAPDDTRNAKIKTPTRTRIDRSESSREGTSRATGTTLHQCTYASPRPICLREPSSPGSSSDTAVGSTGKLERRTAETFSCAPRRSISMLLNRAENDDTFYKVRNHYRARHAGANDSEAVNPFMPKPVLITYQAHPVSQTDPYSCK